MTESTNTLTWQVELQDGTTLRQSAGYIYGDLPRDQIYLFQLLLNEFVVAELKPDEGHPVSALRYRRRTVADEGGRRETFVVLGWDPMGPVFVFDSKGNKIKESLTFNDKDILLRRPETIARLGES